MKIQEENFDHVAIAVNSLEEGKKFYEALGWNELYVEDVPTEKVKVGMYELANGSRIELLEALDESSPIQKFLDKKGPGIHHICLKVKDIQGKINQLKELGVKMINDTPKSGAHNCKIAFVHPKSTGGVLIELSESGDSANA